MKIVTFGILFPFLWTLAYLQSSVVPYDTSDCPLKKGIIFHEDRKILLAEKFINVQFLLPFPMFDAQLQDKLTHLTSTLADMWNLPTFFCDLNYTNVNMTGFNVNWLVSEVQKEIDAANFDLERLHLETASFLRPKIDDSTHRSKRAIPIGAAALGAIGLFGAGISMGPGSCGLSGIFGSCQSEQNAKQIDRLFAFSSSLSDNVQELNSDTNDKFFIVSMELRTLREVQSQMREIQNANWATVSEQMEAFRHDIHVMRNCDQFLFTRQQVNFNFDTVSSLLSLFYANIKSYRAALFAFHVNVMNSIPTLLNK